MKTSLKLAILLALSAGMVSCITPVQGTGSVENLERQSPVTSPPDVKEGEAAQAAAYYSSGHRRYHYLNSLQSWNRRNDTADHYYTGRHHNRYGYRGWSGY